MSRRPERRLKPRSVCPRCEGHQDRRMVIHEKPQSRHWGDADPFLELGDCRIHQFICIVCGNVGAYALAEGQER